MMAVDHYFDLTLRRGVINWKRSLRADEEYFNYRHRPPGWAADTMAYPDMVSKKARYRRHRPLGMGFTPAEWWERAIFAEYTMSDPHLYWGHRGQSKRRDTREPTEQWERDLLAHVKPQAFQLKWTKRGYVYVKVKI